MTDESPTKCRDDGENSLTATGTIEMEIGGDGRSHQEEDQNPHSQDETQTTRNVEECGGTHKESKKDDALHGKKSNQQHRSAGQASERAATEMRGNTQKRQPVNAAWSGNASDDLGITMTTTTGEKTGGDDQGKQRMTEGGSEEHHEEKD